MKILCIGRNYAEHAKELNSEVPAEPVIFMKPKSALLLPGKPIYYPDFTKELHYECEVVVRIAKNGKFIQEKFAPKYYTHITLGIDFTARDVQREQQKKGLPWEIAKAFDGSAAVGNFMALTELPPLNELNFQLFQNGKMVQDGHPKDMIFNINQLICHASKYFTLNIGDLLFTGTPSGVGPVAVDDKLEGYLQGQKVLEAEVK